MWWFRDLNARLIGPQTIIGAIVLVLGVSILVHDYTQVTTRTIIVEGKDRGGDDGSYRVYTDGDTLAVSDIWFSVNGRRTNSADLFGDIPVCHELVVAVRGWEFGVMSLMPNIDHIVEDLGPVEGCEPQV